MQELKTTSRKLAFPIPAGTLTNSWGAATLGGSSDFISNDDASYSTDEDSGIHRLPRTIPEGENEDASLAPPPSPCPHQKRPDSPSASSQSSSLSTLSRAEKSRLKMASNGPRILDDNSSTFDEEDGESTDISMVPSSQPSPCPSHSSTTSSLSTLSTVERRKLRLASNGPPIFDDSSSGHFEEVPDENFTASSPSTSLSSVSTSANSKERILRLKGPPFLDQDDSSNVDEDFLEEAVMNRLVGNLSCDLKTTSTGSSKSHVSQRIANL